MKWSPHSSREAARRSAGLKRCCTAAARERPDPSATVRPRLKLCRSGHGQQGERGRPRPLQCHNWCLTMPAPALQYRYQLLASTRPCLRVRLLPPARRRRAAAATSLAVSSPRQLFKLICVHYRIATQHNCPPCASFAAMTTCLAAGDGSGGRPAPPQHDRLASPNHLRCS
jgi:hypothetical protein